MNRKSRRVDIRLRGRQAVSTPSIATLTSIVHDSGPACVPASSPKHPGPVLGLSAVALLAASLFAAFVVPQTPGRLDRASAALFDELGLWSWITSPVLPVPRGGATIAALLVVMAVLAFAAYGVAVYASWGRAAGRGLIGAAMGVAAVLSLVSVLALPNVSSDIYDYISFGRVAAVHGENPYETAPSAFPDDPTYPYASENYRERPDNKLPGWQLVNRMLAEAGIDSPVGNLMLYRVALFALGLGTLALLALAVRSVEPRAVLAAIVTFGWNPVVTTFVASKTDTVMVFFLALGAALLVRRQLRFADLAFVLSVLVKLITLPLVAVYWLRSLRLRRFWDAAALVVIAVVVTLAVYAPFGGFDLLLDQAGLFGGGRSDGASSAPAPAQPGLSEIPRPLLLAGVLAFVVWAAWRQDGTDDRLLRTFGLVGLAFAILVVDPRSPWYLFTAIAAASLARNWRVSSALGALCFGAYLFNSWRAASSAEHPLPDMGVPKELVVVVPLLLAALVVSVVLLRRRRDASSPAGGALADP